MTARMFGYRLLAVALLHAAPRLGLAQNAPAAPARNTAVLLTNVQQVVSLANEALDQGRYEARVRGVIIYISNLLPRFYVQDGTNGLQARLTGSVENFRVGQLVEVSGTVVAGQPYPSLVDARAMVLGEVPMPDAPYIPASRLAAGDAPFRFVTVRGVVRDMVSSRNGLMLQMTHEGAMFELNIPDGSVPLPRYWLDAELEVRGKSYPFYNSRGRALNFRFHTQTTNFIRVLNPGSGALFDRPSITIGEMAREPQQWGPRYKIAGTVTIHRPGTIYLQDDTGVGLAIPLAPLPKTADAETLEHEPQTLLQPGERIELIGARHNWYSLVPTLIFAEYRRLGKGPLPSPRAVSIGDLKAGRHAGEVVSIEARLVNVRDWGNVNGIHESLVLQVGEDVFQANWDSETPAKWNLKADSYVRVTGVNEAEGGQFKNRCTFQLLLRSPADVVPAAEPSFWASPSVRRASLAAGGVGLVAGVWILFQRRQMRRLRASEGRFRALIDNSFDATVVLNVDGSVKYMSPSGLRLLGGDKRGDPFMTTGLSDVIHPDDLPRIMRAHREVLERPNKSQRVSGYRILAADGGLRYAEAVGTNCLHVPGVEGIVVNIRDITERMVADEAARRSEAVTRTINYFATSLLEKDTEEDILWDLAKNCISQLDFVDCVVYLLDRSRHVLVQRAALGPKSPEGRVILNPLLIPLGQGIVGSVAATGKSEMIADTSMDARYIVDDIRRFSEITVPIIANGEVIGVIDSEHSSKSFFTEDHLKMLTAIASLCANKLVRVWAEQQLRTVNTDLEHRVTERTTELRDINTRLQKEVAAREEAQEELSVALAAEKELNQLKSSFVSMVSHEFRTPLEVILSSSNILDRYLDRLPPEKRKAQLRAIRKSVTRMNDLMEDVLLLGKFDAAGMACQPSAIDLVAFCRRAVSEIESAASRSGAIRVQAENLGGDASADEGLLHHVLTNLLSNALKYSPPASVVELSIARHGPEAEFVIRDGGCGIPAADQARLFTAFYRGANVGQTQGSGLGLVIVKRCLDLHGGTIHCESVEGQGTTFTVTLPLFDGTRIFRRRGPATAETAVKIAGPGNGRVEEAQSHSQKSESMMP